jgi:hypothetical protein
MTAIPHATYVFICTANRRVISASDISPSDLDAMFAIIVMSQFLCAIFNAVFQSSLYGLAGELSRGGELTGAGEFGKGVAGVLVVVVRIITKASFETDLTGQGWSCIVFFCHWLYCDRLVAGYV